MAKEVQNYEKHRKQVEAARQKFNTFLAGTGDGKPGAISQIGDYRTKSKKDDQGKFQIGKRLTGDEEDSAYRTLGEGSNARLLLNQGTDETETKKARTSFIEALQQLVNVQQKAEADNSPLANPIGSSITLKELLGNDDEMVRTFKEAMEEESKSKLFREAVFNASSNSFEGEKWTKRPVIIVGGPSASGKSTITAKAIEENQALFFETKPTSDSTSESSQSDTVEVTAEGIPADNSETARNHENIVVSSDGGVVREVCQMRNLIIDYARSLGYSEIKDLQSETKEYLETIKGNVQNAVMATKDLGLIKPLTFSELIVEKQIDDILQHQDDTHNVMAFLEVVPDSKEGVKQQGETRSREYAWDKINEREFSLNAEDGRPEFKKYEGGIKYWCGKEGSGHARRIFKDKSKDGFIIIGRNDLVKGPAYPISIRVKERWKRFAACDGSFKRLKGLKKKDKYGNRTIEITENEVVAARGDLAKYLELCDNYFDKKGTLSDEQKEIFGPKFLDFELETTAQIKIAKGYRYLCNHFPKVYGTKGAEIKKAKSELDTLLEEAEKKGYSTLVLPGDKSQEKQTAIKESIKKLNSLLDEYNVYNNRNYGTLAEKWTAFFEVAAARVVLGANLRWWEKLISPILKLNRGLYYFKVDKHKSKLSFYSMNAGLEKATEQLEKRASVRAEMNDIVSGVSVERASEVRKLERIISPGSNDGLDVTNPSDDVSLDELQAAIEQYKSQEIQLPDFYAELVKFMYKNGKLENMENTTDNEIFTQVNELLEKLREKKEFKKSFVLCNKTGQEKVLAGPKWYPIIENMPKDNSDNNPLLEHLKSFKKEGIIQYLTKNKYKGTRKGFKVGFFNLPGLKRNEEEKPVDDEKMANVTDVSADSTNTLTPTK